MKRVGIVAVAVSLVLGAGACSGDDAEETTTTASDAVTTTSATQGNQASASTTTTTATTTSTSEGDPSTVTIPRYQIVSREAGEDGDILVVLLDPDSYDGLTDIDLQNVVAEVVDEFPPVLEAHVVDSPEAADVVLEADRTEEDDALLADHYLARLEEGFRIVFSGPFEGRGDMILGS
jgi:hypothetical protein